MTEPLYRIAPLKWKPYRDFDNYFVANAIGIEYGVRLLHGSWHWSITDDPWQPCITILDGQSACQSHWKETLSKYLEKAE